MAGTGPSQSGNPGAWVKPASSARPQPAQRTTCPSRRRPSPPSGQCQALSPPAPPHGLYRTARVPQLQGPGRLPSLVSVDGHSRGTQSPTAGRRCLRAQGSGPGPLTPRRLCWAGRRRSPGPPGTSKAQGACIPVPEVNLQTWPRLGHSGAGKGPASSTGRAGHLCSSRLTAGLGHFPIPGLTSTCKHPPPERRGGGCVPVRLLLRIDSLPGPLCNPKLSRTLTAAADGGKCHPPVPAGASHPGACRTWLRGLSRNHGTWGPETGGQKQAGGCGVSMRGPDAPQGSSGSWAQATGPGEGVVHRAPALDLRKCGFF